MAEPESVEILDLISFIRVVETGSIAGAASRLGIAKSIVSRRISRLENFLGATLLTRSQREQLSQMLAASIICEQLLGWPS